MLDRPERAMTQVFSITTGAIRRAGEADSSQAMYSVAQQPVIHHTYFAFDPPIAMRPARRAFQDCRPPLMQPSNYLLGCSLHDAD